MLLILEQGGRMETDFDRSVNRKGTSSIKWDELKIKFGREDLLPFWVADMDFSVPECLIKALRKRCRHPVFGYSFRSDAYYQSICSWYATRHHWQISREWILSTPGVVPALSLAVRAYTEIGDKVLVQTPVYDPFFAAIRDNERCLITSPLILQNNRYQMDFSDLERKFRQGVRLMLFCSPHNPVGRVWQRDELEQLLALCRQYGVLLVSDEIHSDLVFRPCLHFPVARIAGDNQAWIILNSPSKSFNVAGLCTGYAIIADPVLRSAYEKELGKSGLLIGNIFGMEALTAAYQGGEKWLESLLIYLQGNYRYIVDFLCSEIPQIVPVQLEGTYLLWLDCRQLPLSPDELTEFFVNKAGLGLTPGQQYGEEGKGFMRFNFGCPRSLIEKALLSLKKAVHSL